jgi:hypothetical protein
MTILRRDAAETKKESAKEIASPASGQRVEITVEREIVTMLVRSHPAKDAENRATSEALPEEPTQHK